MVLLLLRDHAATCSQQIKDMQVEIFYPRDREISESLYSYSVLFSDIEQKTQIFTVPGSVPRQRDLFAVIKHHVQLEDLIRFTVALRCFVHLCTRMGTKMDSKLPEKEGPPRCPTKEIMRSVHASLFSEKDDEYIAPMIDLLMETLTNETNRASSKVYELVMRARKIVSLEIARLVDQKLLEARNEQDLRDFWSCNAAVLDSKIGRPPEPHETEQIQVATSVLFEDIRSKYPEEKILENIFESETDMAIYARYMTTFFWDQFEPLLIQFAEATFSEVMDDPEKVFELPRRIGTTSARLAEIRAELETAKNNVQLFKGRELTRETTLELKSKYFIPTLFDAERYVSDVRKYRTPAVPSDKRVKTHLLIKPLTNRLSALDNRVRRIRVLQGIDVVMDSVNNGPRDPVKNIVAEIHCSPGCVNFIKEYQTLPRTPFHPSPVVTWCQPGTKRLDLAINGEHLESLLFVMCDEHDVENLYNNVSTQKRRGQGRIVFIVCSKELGLASTKAFDVAKAIIEHFNFPFWWSVAPTVFGNCREISLAHLGSREASLCRALYLVESQVMRKHRDYVLAQGTALVKEIKNAIISLNFSDLRDHIQKAGVEGRHAMNSELTHESFLQFYGEIEDIIVRAKQFRELQDSSFMNTIEVTHAKIRALLTSLSLICLSNGKTLLDDHAVAFPNFYKRKTDPRGVKIGLHATDSFRDFSFAFTPSSTAPTRNPIHRIYSDILAAKHIAISFHYVGFAERVLDVATLCIAFIRPKTLSKQYVHEQISLHPGCQNAEIYVANCPALNRFSPATKKSMLDEFCSLRVGLMALIFLTFEDFLQGLMYEPPQLPEEFLGNKSNEVLAVIDVGEIIFLMSSPSFEDGTL